MKKTLLTAIAIIGMVFAFCACSGDDPSEHSAYTEKQQKVFALFNGTWAGLSIQHNVNERKDGMP